MTIAHECLSELLQVNRYARHKVHFVSMAGGGSVRLDKFLSLVPTRQLKQFFYQGWIHLSAALRVAAAEDCDVVVVMEFSPKHMYLANILIWCMRKRVMFIMHGCQQLARKNLGSRLALMYFKMFRFETIQFEIGDSVLPAPYRVGSQRNLILPMPTQDTGQLRLLPGERTTRRGG